MLQLKPHIDRSVAALLRYMTAPLAGTMAVPLRNARSPYRVHFPGSDLVALAARAPMPSVAN